MSTEFTKPCFTGELHHSVFVAHEHTGAVEFERGRRLSWTDAAVSLLEREEEETEAFWQMLLSFY